ncbi:MAG: hypothetical protein HYU66_09990 [Armatimonadetes bacterium]|nr:hypothetical protein [Armatimonadota bacterium]
MSETQPAACQPEALDADWPNVWSGDQLLAWSGLDGPTRWESAVCARTLSPELGVACDSSPPLNIILRAVAGGRVYAAVPGGGEHAFGELAECEMGSGGFRVSLTLGVAQPVLAWEFGFTAGDLARAVVELRNPGQAAADVELIVEASVPPPGQPGPALAPGDGLEAVAAASLPAAVAAAVASGSACWRARLHAEPGGVATVSFGVCFGASAVRTDYAVPPQLVPSPTGENGLSPLLRRTRAKATAILRANVFGPEGNMPRRWMVTQRWRHRNLNTFHAPFLAVGTLAVDPELAVDVLWSALAQQQANGLIPEQAWPQGASVDVPPPLLCWGFWNLYQATRDLQLLDDAVGRLKDYVKYPLAARLLERLGHARSRGARFLTWGLGDGSNMVNSPRFDYKEAFASIDFTSYAVSEIHYVARIIEEVMPEHREAVHLGWMGEELARETQEYFWDAAQHCFVDRYPDDDAVDAHTLAGLVPLFAGVPSAEQAAQVVEEHLQNPDEFWTAAPLASLAADDPRCDQNQWRGAMWPAMNLLIVLGLRRYGYNETADGLRQKTLEEVARWYQATGRLWEYYDSTGRRSPADLPRGRRVGALSDYGWTAAAFLALLHDTAVV